MIRHLSSLLLLASAAAAGDTFRPPAVPLVVMDPYISTWSCADRLTDDWPRHWTGKTQALCGLARIDGHAFRWCGPQPAGVPDLPAMEQRSLRVGALSTQYVFAAGGVELSVSFLSPAVPGDLQHVGWPVGWVEWSARSTDGGSHDVGLYLDVTGEWVVNTTDQPVEWSRVQLGSLQAVRIGSAEQKLLGRAGDDVRLDWGHLYLVAGQQALASFGLGGHASVRSSFAAGGGLPAVDDLRQPRAADDDWPVLAVSVPLGRIGADPVARHVMLVCDEGRNIELMEQRLRPWWMHDGTDIAALIVRAEAEHELLAAEVRSFEQELDADLVAVGGEHYAQLCDLAFRQVLGAHALSVDGRGRPAHFPKECFSNGCISTVDVIYPAAPFFLVFNPALLEAQLRPVLEYAASGRWPHPFAPHDLGTFPLANGQVYGGGERTVEDQMPVEECGNLLLLVSALELLDGRDTLAREFTPQLDAWAQYLSDAGWDPANQLCTDDFAGHLAHNVNLSLKATLALDAWTRASGTAHLDGKDWSHVAHDFKLRWLAAAGEPPTPLAFDQPGTWSQKYNLVWDGIFGLQSFPPSLAAGELAQYAKVSGPFGPPLDGRRGYAKLDWSTWVASFAPDRDGFAAAFEPLWKFANATPQRVPLTDWYETHDARQVGFQARSVVGGIFLRLLQDKERADKWRAKAR
jgi:hypothetical protein